METDQQTQEQREGAAPAAAENGSAATQAAPEEVRRKDKAKIKFESLMQRGEAVTYFSALVDGLRHGHLQFKQRDETVELSPAEQVQVEVRASRKGDKEKVSFELSWRTGDHAELEVSG